METFKYYKRGKGELDTSNFPDIIDSGVVFVDELRCREFVSLYALDLYIQKNFDWNPPRISVEVLGYVDHMRGDKDAFPVSKIYDQFLNLDIEVGSIQHESTEVIVSAGISEAEVIEFFNENTLYQLIGCDASVPKFFNGEISCAKKVRESGKVTGISLDSDSLDDGAEEIILVDDILGGGATVDALYEVIRSSGCDKKISLWVRYNEGIHSDEFLNKFHQVYLGDTI